MHIHSLKRLIRRGFPGDAKSDYLRISLPDFDVLFHRRALEDDRGIGRFSREVLAELQRREVDPGTRAAGRPEVNFFTTIHWCPDPLPKRSVVVVMDVIPLLLPNLFKKHRSVWKGRFGPVARSADRVLSISRSSARDVADKLGLDAGKIGVVYCGITGPDTPAPGATTGNEAPYLCFMGAADPHKNLGVVLRALALTRHAGLELRIIGSRQAELMPLIAGAGVEGRVKLLGRLEDDDARRVIAGATAFVFPSRYEGFGLPPFEAALCGTPSVCAARPAMDELLQDAALFADPELPHAWAEAFDLLLDRPDLRASLASAALERARSFTWSRTTDLVVEALREVALKPRP